MINLFKKTIILLIISIIIVIVIWIKKNNIFYSSKHEVITTEDNELGSTNIQKILVQDTLEYNNSKEEENILLKNLVITNQLLHRVIIKFIFNLDYTDEINKLRDMQVSEDKIKNILDKLKFYYSQFVILPEYEQIFPEKNNILSKIIKIEKLNKLKTRFNESDLLRELMLEPELIRK